MPATNLNRFFGGAAWDKNWVSSYGGVDDPVRRRGYGPAGFRPRENPFYVALPYCDMRAGRLKPEAAKVVPWFIAQFRGVGSSVCKGHWLKIRHGAKICYAQWEDVGPFSTDSSGYVFGGKEKQRIVLREFIMAGGINRVIEKP